MSTLYILTISYRLHCTDDRLVFRSFYLFCRQFESINWGFCLDLLKTYLVWRPSFGHAFIVCVVQLVGGIRFASSFFWLEKFRTEFIAYCMSLMKFSVWSLNEKYLIGEKWMKSADYCVKATRPFRKWNRLFRNATVVHSHFIDLFAMCGNFALINCIGTSMRSEEMYEVKQFTSRVDLTADELSPPLQRHDKPFRQKSLHNEAVKDERMHLHIRRVRCSLVHSVWIRILCTVLSLNDQYELWEQ